MSEDSETPSGLRKALSLSPEQWIKVRAGTLWGVGTFVVACTITCTVYVVRMSDKTDRSLAGIEDISRKLEDIKSKTDVLWADRERLARRP